MCLLFGRDPAPAPSDSVWCSASRSVCASIRRHSTLLLHGGYSIPFSTHHNATPDSTTLIDGDFQCIARSRDLHPRVWLLDAPYLRLLLFALSFTGSCSVSAAGHVADPCESWEHFLQSRAVWFWVALCSDLMITLCAHELGVLKLQPPRLATDTNQEPAQQSCAHIGRSLPSPLCQHGHPSCASCLDGEYKFNATKQDTLKWLHTSYIQLNCQHCSGRSHARQLVAAATMTEAEEFCHCALSLREAALQTPLNHCEKCKY